VLPFNVLSLLRSKYYSGVIMPHYVEGNSVLLLAGKGGVDGSRRLLTFGMETNKEFRIRLL
jgi:hypothetical protein